MIELLLLNYFSGGKTMKHSRVPRISLGTQIIIGLVLGIIVGAATYHNQVAISTMSGLGTIFLRLIQMIVMPIVVSCLTVGIANIGDLRKLGRIGGKTLLYFEVLIFLNILLLPKQPLKLVSGIQFLQLFQLIFLNLCLKAT